MPTDEGRRAALIRAAYAKNEAEQRAAAEKRLAASLVRVNCKVRERMSEYRREELLRRIAETKSSLKW